MDVKSRNGEKFEIFSNFLAHPIETPILTDVRRSVPYILDHIWQRWEKRNGNCPMHVWDHPQIFWIFNSPSPRLQGPMDPTSGGGTSADIVSTQIKFGVDPSTRWDIAQKPPKCKKIHIDSHSNENFISPFFRPPGAANPQKGRRHIRNQSTPACKIWFE